MAQKPALQELTANNHGPAVVVAALIFTIVALSTVLTRLLTRFKVTHRLVGDDYLILVSIILSIAQTVALIVACNHGLGHHRADITDPAFNIYSKATYASDILLIFTLASAKASVAYLIKGLNPPRATVNACYVILAVIGLWAFSSVLAIAFQCQLPEPWNLDGKCIDLFAVDVYNAALNMFTDIALIVVPLILMLNVQVPANKRWLVVSLFASRIIVVGFSIAAIATRRTAFLSSSDLTWDLVTSTILLQAMVASSIMTACLPSIRRFLADLRSGLIGIRISEPLEKTMRNSTTGTSPRNSKIIMSTDTRASKSFSRGARLSQVKSTVTTLANEEMDAPSERERFTPGRKVSSKTTIRTSESVEGLNENVILHTIDYEITYQDVSYGQEPKSSFVPTNSPFKSPHRGSENFSWSG